MANKTSSLINPALLPEVNKIASWFFTLLNGIPARFFYYDDGVGGLRIVMAMRCKDYYPEMMYTDSLVVDTSTFPVSSDVIYGFKNLMFLLTDNVFVPWTFEAPTDDHCAATLVPNVFYDLREVIAVKVDDEYQLTHVQPSWIPLCLVALVASINLVA